MTTVFRSVLSILSMTGLLFAVYVTSQSQIETLEVVTHKIQPNGGYAYTYELPELSVGWPILSANPMQWLLPDSSAVKLRSEGREIGPGNSLHQDIRDYGGGRYSLWGDVLYLSAPDHSDPRLAARDYELRIQPSLSYVGAAGVALLFGVFIWASGLLRAVIKACRGLKKFLDQHTAATCFSLAVLVLAALLWSLHSNWTNGKSSGLSLATYYPISDAAIYWIGAHDLLSSIAAKKYTPTPILEACQRRIIYTTLLAGISVVSAGSITSVIVIQAILCSVALWILLRSCAQILGWIGSFSLVAFLGVYVWRHLLGQTMTENAGFIFGVSGIAFLIHYGGINRWRDLFLGLSLVSIGLSSRAGAVLVLPALFVWSILYLQQRSVKKTLIAAAIATIACSSGFLLQKGINRVVGGNPENYGNFSYVLYGLAHGGKSWAYVMERHGDELTGTTSENDRKIYALALNQIEKEPLELLKGLRANLKLIAVRGPSSLFDGQMPAVTIIALAFALIGLGRCLLEWRHAVSGLMIFAAIGIFGSSLFIIGDGGERLFAATVGFDAFIIAAGVSAVSAVITKSALSIPLVPNTSQLCAQYSAPTVRGYACEPRVLFPMLLICTMMLPFSPLAGRLTERIPNIKSTYADVFTLDTSLQDPGTVMISIAPTGSPRPCSYSFEALEAGFPSGAWYAKDVEGISDQLLIQMPVLKNQNAINTPPMLWLIGESALVDHIGKKLRLHIENKVTGLFGIPYLKITHAEILP